MPEVWIGSRRYATKKARQEAVQAILGRYGLGQVVDQEDDDLLLRDLLDMHPDAADRRVRTAGAPGLLVLRLGPRGLSVRRADHPAALLLHCRTVHPWRLMRRHGGAGCGARGQHRSGGGLETAGDHRASPLALRMPCLRYPRTMASWPLRGRR